MFIAGRAVSHVLDDVADGLDSLRLIARLPVDWVKRRDDIMHALLEISATAGLCVIAQQIEIRAEPAQLRKLPVVRVRGKLIHSSGPLPVFN